MGEIISNEREFLLFAVRRSLSEKARKRRDALLAGGLDWSFIQHQVKYHRLGGLLYEHCTSEQITAQIPPDILQCFHESYQQTYLYNTLLYRQFENILQTFEAHNITPVLLKGIFLAKWIYRNLALRPMNDIDLLLDTQESEVANRILEESGYSNILHHLTYVSDWHKKREERLFSELKSQGYHWPVLIKSFGAFNVCVELHHRITPSLLLQNLHSVAIPDSKFTARTLSPEYFLLHLCFHLQLHSLEHKTPYLLWYYDIAEFVHVHNNVDWKAFLALCQQYQMEKIVLPRLYEAYCFFDIPLPATMLFAGHDFQLSFEKIFSEQETNQDLEFLRSALKSESKEGLRYLWECLFPAREFLISRYNIRHRWQVYPKYVLRCCYALIRGGKLIRAFVTNWWKNKA
jgi:hypothetical protein